MKIHLAPMEGVVNHTMRDMLTRVGGIDRCVTEFVRVTNHLLTTRTFYRLCPELHNAGLTPSGTPVYIQLLGGEPELMAANARIAAQLGAPGIDINFGCPAKKVNRSDGGSIILREPQRVYDIVSAVRDTVPEATPVTAKIRLGYEDRSLLNEICQAVFEAKANELTIHARTKADGYKPPAYWDAIADIQAISPIPIIANGEIWNSDDYHRCVEQSGCSDVMLGRGILSCPDLAQQIRYSICSSAEPLSDQPTALAWPDIIELISHFSAATEQQYQARYVGGRIKQWLGYLRRHYSAAEQLFEAVKRLRCPKEIALAIESHKRSFV